MRDKYEYPLFSWNNGIFDGKFCRLPVLDSSASSMEHGAILVLFKQVPEKAILKHPLLLSVGDHSKDSVVSLEKGNVLLGDATVSCS